MTDKHDKLVDWLDSTCHFIVTSPREKLWELHADQLAAFASAHVASLCADVEQDGFRLVSVNVGFTELMEALDRADRKGYMPDAIYSAYEGFQYRDPASTVASLTAQRDAAMARLVNLEKILEECSDNINPERGFAEELEAEIRSVLNKGEQNR